jgi:hypothetical protein
MTDSPPLPAVDSRAPHSPGTQARSRRAILAGAVGGIGALAATIIGGASRTQAAAGSPMIIGSSTNNAGSSNTILTTNSSVIAFELIQNGLGTALMGYTTPTAGTGRGVYGRTDSPNGDGVQARNAGAAGTGAGIRAFGGNNVGVEATTGVASGRAVRGVNSAPSGTAYAIHGRSNSPDGVGVVGYNGATVGDFATGVGGVTTSSTGAGVVGVAASLSGANQGVWGETGSPDGIGAVGYAYATSGSNVGVLAQSNSAAGWAGVFVGNVDVSGSITAASANAAIKSFKIDHPLDPANKYLVHSCVESNERLNAYSGTATTDANGEANVQLPTYFAALNRDARYQLTPVGAAMPGLHVGSEIAKGSFVIAGAEPHSKVCWQVVGTRHDAYSEAHPLQVEPQKAATERGRYLHPIENGQPLTKGLGLRIRRQANVDAASLER